MQKRTPDVPLHNLQGQVLFRLQVDKKTFQVKTLRRGTGFQFTGRRPCLRLGQQTRPHAISLRQPNGLRMETLQIPRRLLTRHRNLPRGQNVNPRLKDPKVPHEKVPRHPQKGHLHGWQLGHVLIWPCFNICQSFILLLVNDFNTHNKI